MFLSLKSLRVRFRERVKLSLTSDLAAVPCVREFKRVVDTRMSYSSFRLFFEYRLPAREIAIGCPPSNDSNK